MKTALVASVHWVLKERVDGLWVPKVQTKNLLTSYGLTAFASAPSGTYMPPVYLVIETTKTTFSNLFAAGVTSITTAGDPTLVGDTQLVLDPNTATQETVTFSAKSGTGPYTWTLTAPTTYSHNSGAFVVRAPTVNDTLASVIAEAQFDPTYSPNGRQLQTASYSPGAGQNTMQFFLAGIQATNVYFAHVGLADAKTIGQGNLHNYAAFGYNHNNTNDIEIDITWTLTTS